MLVSKGQETPKGPPYEVQQDDLSTRQEFGECTSCRTPCCSHVLLLNLDPFTMVSCRTLQIAEPKARNLEKDYLAEPWNAVLSKMPKGYLSRV